MSVVEWFDRPAVPVAYAVLIGEVASSFGVGPELFEAAGIAPDALADADGRLTAIQAGNLLQVGMDLTREPGFGYEIGLRSRLFGVISTSGRGSSVGSRACRRSTWRYWAAVVG